MTVYDDDPVSAAQRWADLGAGRLHVVDLDGAHEGKPKHKAEVAKIIAATDVPVQVAGGIRDMDAVRGWIDWGADRVVLGTAALTDADFLSSVLDFAPGRIVVALDARDGEIRLSGWTKYSGLRLEETAVRLADAGVRRLLVTDISRDGMLSGSNTDQLRRLMELVSVPIIASGGVGSLDDVSAVAASGAEAVIVGKALYEGTLHLPDALAAAWA